MVRITTSHGCTPPGSTPSTPDGVRLRRLFTALAGPDRDGRFVRRPLHWGEVAADLRPLVLRLAAGRLVVGCRPGRRTCPPWTSSSRRRGPRGVAAPRGQAADLVRPRRRGRRLLVSTRAGVQEVWDLDRQEIIGEPFPAPGFPLPIGFTADGRAVTSTRQGDGTTQTFWDVATGADDGTIHFLLGHDGALEIDEGTWMKVAGVGGEYGGPLPFRMAATAQQWFDRLCTFSNRPFTDVERAALPAGSVIEPPC